MAKDRKEVTCNGRAALYAILWEDIRNAAMDCGWAVALHGSLSRDMDIIAMKWEENCTDAETMINTIIENCFGDSVVSQYGTRWVRGEKPHGRTCVAIPIYGDHYLDISFVE
jgi:hypothetical protein